MTDSAAGFSLPAWCIAIALSIAVHAAMAIGIDPPQPGMAQPPAGPPISVAGSLSSVLGAAVSSDASSDQSLEPVKPERIKAIAAVSPSVRPQTPDRTITATHMASPTSSSQVATAQSVTPDPIALVSTTAAVPVRQIGITAAQSTTKTTPPVSPATSVKVVDPPRQNKQHANPAPKNNPARTSTAQQQSSKTSSASRSGSSRSGSAGSSRGGGGRSQASAGSVANYGAAVRARILSNRPASSGAGRVVVSFGLSSAGGLRFAKVVNSSGNAGLDRAALSAVRRSAPFPRPPAGASSGQLSFSIPFSFR
jgi:protein TonB